MRSTCLVMQLKFCGARRPRRRILDARLAVLSAFGEAGRGGAPQTACGTALLRRASHGSRASTS